MGRKSTTGGVMPAGDRIRFDFAFQGARLRPSLPLKPTPANLKHAHRLIAEIRERIRQGTFALAEFFPDYTHAGPAVPVHRHHVTHYIDTWLATCSGLSPSTQNGYRKAAKHWRTWFGAQRVDQVLHSQVAAAIGAHPWGTNKTRNNVLSVGKQIFALAVRDIKIDNPVDGVEFLKVQRAEPDPFELAEVDTLLAALARRYGAELADYYEFAFFTGLRPSEQIALAWPNVTDRAAHIDSTRVRGIPKVGTNSPRLGITAPVDRAATKTYTVRDVRLNDRARAVIARQRARTQLAGAAVFWNPHTHQPWADENKQAQAFRKALQLANLRPRVPYQTRHTYATMLLMAGAKPGWAANQLGHSVEMFYRIYARWIPDAERDEIEIGKLERFIA
jgi:integrase